MRKAAYSTTRVYGDWVCTSPELAVTVKLYVPVVVPGVGEAPLPALQRVSAMAARAKLQISVAQTRARQRRVRGPEGLRVGCTGITIHRQGNGTTAQGGTCIQKCDRSSGPDSRVAGWTFAVRPTLLPTAMTAGLAVTLVVAAICAGATQENAIIVNSKTGKRSNRRIKPHPKATFRLKCLNSGGKTTKYLEHMPVLDSRHQHPWLRR